MSINKRSITILVLIIIISLISKSVDSIIDNKYVGEPVEIFNLPKDSSTESMVIDLAKSKADITIYGAKSADNLGKSITSGDINNDNMEDIIIGAPEADTLDRSDAGEVYVIYGTKLKSDKKIELSKTKADITIKGSTGDKLGTSIISGDINNDGIDDLIIGAPGLYPNGVNAGYVYIIFGSSNFEANKVIDLNNNEADIRFRGPHQNSGLGKSVASADVNKDGISDIIMGSPRASPTEIVGTGAVYVFYGKSSFEPHERIELNNVRPDITIAGSNSLDNLGFSVTSNDINDDGISDLIMGSINSDNGIMPDTGFVYVIYGRYNFEFNKIIDFSNTMADITIKGKISNGLLGTSLVSSDVNKDGIPDMIIGAPRAYTSDSLSSGAVYIIYGDSNFEANKIIDLRTSNADLTIGGENILDRLGSSVSSDDINKDRISDIIIGAPGAHLSGSPPTGATYVIFGNSQFEAEKFINLNQVPANIMIRGSNDYDDLGYSVASGDINNDGISDVIVSAINADQPRKTNAGAVYVIYGHQTIFTPEQCGSKIICQDGRQFEKWNVVDGECIEILYLRNPCSPLPDVQQPANIMKYINNLLSGFVVFLFKK